MLWANAGSSLSVQVTRAIKLLDLYRDELFALAASEAAARGICDLGALEVICDRLRRKNRQPSPIDLKLSADLDDPEVIPHDLRACDDHDD